MPKPATTIMDMYRKDISGVQAIGHVLKIYEEATALPGGSSMLLRSLWRATWQKSLTLPSNFTK